MEATWVPTTDDSNEGAEMSEDADTTGSMFSGFVRTKHGSTSWLNTTVETREERLGI
jgi:hypothetical protein